MTSTNQIFKLLCFALLLAGFFTSCAAQEAPSVRADLYDCEGCEGVFETEHNSLTSIATLALEGEAGEPLVIRGTVYQADGKTPAPNVVLYVYQTDADGYYSRGGESSEWSRRHGLLRGWLKTGDDGTYVIHTIKPGPYPNLGAPAHIHPTVLEAGKPPYWIDDIVFAGEFGVTEGYKARKQNRGGPGIVTLSKNKKGMWIGTRDIMLERHPD